MRAIVGEQIDKSSRFTDWSSRPLSEKQITYALADVTHLRNSYGNLRNESAKARRQSWVEDEMAILENVGTYIVQPEDA